MLGITMGDGALLGVVVHYLVGPLLGFIFVAAVSMVDALRFDTRFLLEEGVKLLHHLVLPGGNISKSLPPQRRHEVSPNSIRRRSTKASKSQESCFFSSFSPAFPKHYFIILVYSLSLQRAIVKYR